MTNQSLYKFGKSYKLCSEKTIQSIFKEGRSVKCYPYVLYYLPSNFSDNTSHKWVFSAPKRNYRKAYQRNRIKRVIKESIRLNKSILEEYLQNKELQLAFFLIYTGKEEMDHKILDKKTKKLFNTIINKLDEK